MVFIKGSTNAPTVRVGHHSISDYAGYAEVDYAHQETAARRERESVCMDSLLEESNNIYIVVRDRREYIR